MSTDPTLGSLPAGVRSALEDDLAEDETFLGGIQCRTTLARLRRATTRLFLTDRRVVEYRPGLLRARTTGYDRDRVTTASVSMGLLFYQLILAGPDLRRSFRVYPDAGRAFADAVRSDEHARIDEAGRFDRLIEARADDVTVDDSPPDPTTVDRWDKWHYVVVLGTVVALVGAVSSSLALLAPGYVSIPITLFLDIRYVEASGGRWQPDVGLYMVGGIVFPLIVVPMYLYRRHETIGL